MLNEKSYTLYNPTVKEIKTAIEALETLGQSINKITGKGHLGEIKVLEGLDREDVFLGEGTRDEIIDLGRTTITVKTYQGIYKTTAVNGKWAFNTLETVTLHF